jgi:YbbR domain-containing protein
MAFFFQTFNPLNSNQMKSLFIFLTAFLLFTSCSQDDDLIEPQSNTVDFTLEVFSSETLTNIKVDILDDNLNVLETYITENESSTSIHIDKGVAFIIYVNDEDGFTCSYQLFNSNNTLVLEGGLGCNVYCYKQEYYN